MHILLTNDDGIDAPGLATLEEAVADRGELSVVAPIETLSGCSHQVNTQQPINVTELSDRRYFTDGTPADCVRVALTHLAPGADWVISGVNAGGNLGIDVYLSGTVAAVREAVFFGKPGIALSQYCRRRAAIDWDLTGEMVRRVLDELLPKTLEPGAFWNVNFPHPESRQASPEIVFCPLDHNQLPVEYDVQGRKYGFRGVYQDRRRNPGTDVDVCFSGQIAVTKVQRNSSG